MISHTNRMGDTYYVHGRRDAKGRWRYTASRDAEGALDKLPEGHEFKENVNGQVSVRKRRPRQITDDEEGAVRRVLDRQGLQRYRVEVDGKQVVIHKPSVSDASLDALGEQVSYRMFDLPGGIGPQVEAMARRELGDEVFERLMAERVERTRDEVAAACRYQAVLKLILTDGKRRRFEVHRMCFRGTGGWLGLDEGELDELLPRYVPHLGQESFFELI